MASMNVAVVLRLVDRLSGRSRAPVRSLNDIAKAARNVGRAGSQMERPFTAALDRMGRALHRFQVRMQHFMSRGGLDAAIEANAGQLSKLRGQLLSTGLVAAPAALPFKRLADTELALTRIGQIAQWKPGEFAKNLTALDADLRRIADSTYQNAGQLAQGLNLLVATGMSEADAKGGIFSVGKVATATGAEIEDLSAAAFALRQNLNIDPAGWIRAFNIMHQGGKMGGFELKDMASWFPSLTTDMSFFGMQGEQAVTDLVAFLEIAKRAAGTADEAANNIRNVFQKIFIKETEQNFKKYAKINFQEVMHKAITDGKNPILEVLRLVDAYVEKHKDNKLFIGDLFADQQAMAGIKALLKHAEALGDMRAELRKAADEDVIQVDFETTIRTLTFQFKRWMIALDKLSNTISSKGLGQTKGLFGILIEWTEKLERLAATYPETTARLLQGAALLFGGALAFKLGRFIWGILAWAALGILRFARWLGGINRLRAGLVGLAVAARFVFGGWRSMAGLIGGALTAAAVIGLVSRIGLLRGALVGLGRAASFLLGPWGMVAAGLIYLIPDGWWTRAGELLSQGFDFLKSIVSGAANAIIGLIDHIRSAINSLSNLSIGGAATGGPSTMEGFPGVGGARARGGSVAAGRLYAVGERGPELFTPSRSGRIIAPYRLAQAGATFAGRGGSPSVSATFHIHGATDPNAVASAVSRRLNQIARSAVHDGFTTDAAGGWAIGIRSDGAAFRAAPPRPRNELGAARPLRRRTALPIHRCRAGGGRDRGHGLSGVFRRAGGHPPAAALGVKTGRRRLRLGRCLWPVDHQVGRECADLLQPSRGTEEGAVHDSPREVQHPQRQPGEAVLSTRYISRAGDVLDLICWRHYGFHAGTAEAVLAANYGLSEQPPVLPAGLTITLPDLPRPRTTPPAVRLWEAEI
jgi:TP901 family phage tail tape measure protein